jgi:hypothetical protein
MHAYLHYSADLPNSILSDVLVFERGMREFVRCFSIFFYRGDASVDTDTCKVHCFMHCLSNTLLYGNPMQYESGKGERGLKDWAKSVSKTAQKTGLDVFLFQTVMRVADRLLLSRALNIVQRQQKQHILPPDDNKEEAPERRNHLSKRRMPHFRYYRREDRVVAVNRKGKELVTTQHTGTIPPNVITALRKEEKDMDVIDIWCEVRLFLSGSIASEGKGGQLLRAHGALDKFGGYFDWVDVSFEVEPIDSESDSDASGDEGSDSAPGNGPRKAARLL